MKLVIKILAGVVISITALFTVALVILINLNFNDYKYVIEKQVQDATGRNFEIKGPLDIDLSMTPSVRVGDVILANADWAKSSSVGAHENMLILEKLEVQIDLKKLIFDDVLDVYKLDVLGLDLIVQKDVNGQLNTDFGSSLPATHNEQFIETVGASKNKSLEASSFLLPILRQVKLRDVNIHYIDPNFSGVDNLNIEQILIDDTDDGLGMNLSMIATAGDFPLTASGEFGSIADLIDVNQPWKFDVEAQLASLDVILRGQLNDPSTAEGLRVALNATSADLGDLTALVVPFGGSQIPALGPLVADAELIMDEKQNLTLKDMNFKLGSGKFLKANVTGDIANLNNLSGLNLDVSANSPSLENLASLLEISLPYNDLGAASVSAKIDGSLSDKISLSSIAVSLDKEKKHSLNVAGNIGDIQNLAEADLKVDGNISSISEVTKALALDLPIGDLGNVKFPSEVVGDLLGSIKLAAIDVAVNRRKKHAIQIIGNIGDVKAFSDVDLKISGTVNSTKGLSELAAVELPVGELGVSKFFANIIGSQKSGLSLPEINLSLIKKNAHALYVKGAISDIKNMSDVDLLYDLDVASLATFGSTLKQDLPDLGAVSSQGNIVGSLSDQISLKELKGKVKQSSFTGNINLSLANTVPKVDAVLNIDRIVASDFQVAGKTNKAQKNQPTPTNTTDNESKVSGRVIPDEAIDFSGLKKLNANLDLDIGLIESTDLSLRPVRLSAKLVNGVLNIDQLSLGDGVGGALKGAFQLDVQKPDASARVRLSSEKFDVGPLISVAGYRDLLSGAMQLNVDLSSKGDSPHTLAAMLGGHVQAVLVDGKMNANSVERYFGKEAKTVTDLLTGGHTKEFDVYCVLADYQVNNGLIKTQNLMIDTEISTILSEGIIDLGQEKLDLTITPRGEVLGFGAAIPVLVQGSFNKVQAIPDPKALVTALGGALAAGSAWPAALAGALMLSDEGRTACSGSSRKAEPAVQQIITKPVDITKEVVKGLLNNLFGN